MEVYKQSLSGEQERWRSQAGNKAQQFEQISFIPSFKDGTPKRSKVLTATERLHVQNRLCRYADYIIWSRQGFHIPFSRYVYPWITPKHRIKTGQLCLQFFAKAIDLKPLIYWWRPMTNVLKQANKAMLAKENRK